ncbi:uncharacterized protein ANIA_11555 [Aspergillus nidulans FGSC A4]|uniref:Uncharacterized protein n=1 Tax=Emericella nidulans (strain FGSC A4 / ATCC 38163 / CBS 112.46 / NRRL 194 / M139) TaxID=227321 RepID=C8VCI6_EMENI|nr:hypothetical protein [Aspergillus nidulans FGSC A4]CBF78538.1 TPA: hypothetical protein ANIA_11555 [Aspergillus nidulans FGSC A4]
MKAPAITATFLALTFTLLPCVTAQGVTVNSPCTGAGYACLSGNHAIASCDGRRWQLAAECGTQCLRCFMGGVEWDWRTGFAEHSS